MTAIVHETHRDHEIDILRGLAIVAMVWGNMTPLAEAAHPMPIKFITSVAAPLFFTLAGMMVAHSSRVRSSVRTFPYFVKRGLFIILMGAAIDVLIWGYVPFVTVDVLYMIGLGLPLAYLVNRYMSRLQTLVLVSAIFLLTPWLQDTFAYEPRLTEVPLSGAMMLHGNGLAVLKHWAIDGWFPFFPWAGFMFFGVFLAKFRWEKEEGKQNFTTPLALLTILLLNIGGLICWHYNPPPLLERNGYSEVFYPPSLAFILVYASIIMLLFEIVESTPLKNGWDILAVIGESALFMYVLHLAVIGFGYEPWFGKLDLSQFTLFFAILVFLLIAVGVGLRRLKARYPDMPQLAKWVVGG